MKDPNHKRTEEKSKFSIPKSHILLASHHLKKKNEHNWSKMKNVQYAPIEVS